MKTLSRLAIPFLSLILVSGALATEGGGGAYPNGAEGFMAGAVPPPGTYVLDYVTYYSADKFAGPNGDGVVPGFDLEVWANTLRLLHVTKTQVLGGLWGAHIFVPVLNLDVTVPGASDDQFGLGDVIVDPCIISWHTPTIHAVCGIDIYIPVGAYDAADLANLGRGYWTIEPVAAISYLPPSGLDLSAKLMYDINLENSDTDYTSGQELHADVTIAQRLSPSFTAGVGGYYYKQVTDDDADDPTMEMGKGQVMAIGPQVKFDAGRLSLIAKYQVEFEAENRPEGDKAWLKAIYAF